MKRSTPLPSVLALMGALSLFSMGCRTPAGYHFWHYQSPLRHVAESNKTYFHSGETGKIIAKDPCDRYCEPGCFGFEPTCWAPWPEACLGNCPTPPEEIVTEVTILSDEVVGGPARQAATAEEEAADHSASVPAAAPEEPVSRHTPPSPGPTALQTRRRSLLDGPRSPFDDFPVPARLPQRASDKVNPPTIPVDVESSLPSPSDAPGPQRKPTGTLKPLSQVGDQAQPNVANLFEDRTEDLAAKVLPPTAASPLTSELQTASHLVTVPGPGGLSSRRLPIRQTNQVPQLKRLPQEPAGGAGNSDTGQAAARERPKGSEVRLLQAAPPVGKPARSRVQGGSSVRFSALPGVPTKRPMNPDLEHATLRFRESK